MFKSTKALLIVASLLVTPIAVRYGLLSITTFVVLISLVMFASRLILINYALKTCMTVEIMYMVFYSVLKYMAGNRWMIIGEVLIFVFMRALFYLLFWYDEKYFISFEIEEDNK